MSFKRGDQVRVSPEGERNGIRAFRHGVRRVGTVVRCYGNSVDIKWPRNIGVYSIATRFIEKTKP